MAPAGGEAKVARLRGMTTSPDLPAPPAQVGIEAQVHQEGFYRIRNLVARTLGVQVVAQVGDRL